MFSSLKPLCLFLCRFWLAQGFNARCMCPVVVVAMFKQSQRILGSKNQWSMHQCNRSLVFWVSRWKNTGIKGRDYVYYFLFCYRNDGTHFYSVKRSMGKSVGVGTEGCVYTQHTASKTAFKPQDWLCWRYFKIFFDYTELMLCDTWHCYSV